MAHQHEANRKQNDTSSRSRIKLERISCVPTTQTALIENVSTLLYHISRSYRGCAKVWVCGKDISKRNIVKSSDIDLHWLVALGRSIRSQSLSSSSTKRVRDRLLRSSHFFSAVLPGSWLMRTDGRKNGRV